VSSFVLDSFKPDSESVLSQSDRQFGYNANARRFDEADRPFRRLPFVFILSELIFANLSFDWLFCFNSFLVINLSDGPMIIDDSSLVSITFKSGFSDEEFVWSTWFIVDGIDVEGVGI
jgi:hypothetical protein